MTVTKAAVEESTAQAATLRDVSTRQEVAAYTRISLPTLARWAAEGKGPRFRKAGGRVLYLRADVLTWLDSLAEAS